MSVHVALEELGVFVGQDVDFLDGCGHDERLALMQEDALSGGTEEAALAVETHIDTETVDACIVAPEGFRQLELVCREEWTLHEADDGVAARLYQVRDAAAEVRGGG